jgi:hypothetical protein
LGKTYPTSNIEIDKDATAQLAKEMMKEIWEARLLATSALPKTFKSNSELQNTRDQPEKEHWYSSI